jgi:LacI family transcriptional regulator
MASQKGSRRSTIKDVAAEAEVSISTVSLVMNQKGNVSPDTKDRVLQAARQLRYVPRSAAQHLASNRTGNVGFVLRDDHFTRSEPFYTRIFLGAEFEARTQSRYILLTTIPDSYVPDEHTPRFLQEQNVDGVLIAGRVHPAFIEEAEASGLPIVLADFEAGDHPAVVIDNQNGARAAVEHLLRRGHRRIAFVGADLDHPSLKARLEGYQLALSTGEGEGPTEDELVVTALDEEPTRLTGSTLAERLFKQEPLPTAVFCANDALALGVLDAARIRGIEVPGDLAVVGFDDVEGAAHATPALTTVRVFKEQLGEVALRYLSQLIEEDAPDAAPYERGSHAIRVPTELIVRASS